MAVMEHVFCHCVLVTREPDPGGIQPNGISSVFFFPGLRKLDAQSLNDLARQHHEEDARRERRRAPSVPSPDSLSMDDTPGPSDEERESARSFRRPAFHTERLKFCFNIVGTSSTIKVSSISIG